MERGVNRTIATDRALRAWMRTHGGLITRERAIALGATTASITGRVRRGEWERVFRGVYLDAATAPSHEQVVAAACLAIGPAGVASHRSAAWLWGLIERPPPQPDVSLPGRGQRGRRMRGLRLHQSTDLHRSELTERRGVATTSPARTLIDLASVWPGEVPAAFERGLASRLLSPADVAAELGRLGRRGRPGVAVVRQVLAAVSVAGAPAPSALERRAMQLFVQAHLPVPRGEVSAGPDGAYRLDFAYPERRLAIEVDGYLWHASPAQMGRDLARRNRLLAAGWRVLVYTWRDIVDHPARVTAEITEAYRSVA